MAELKDQIAALESRVLGNPAAMLSLARMLRKDKQNARALAMCRAALALAPKDAKLAAQVQVFVNDAVPQWHFSIVKDAARNEAYDTALRRTVTPASRVLEIGAGTGLLAMMAARAGAAEVFTCEMNPAVAEKAAEIVALNGFAGRVRVIAKHSDTLDANADMGGRADILVSEIVSNNLLGQDVVPAHERAMRHLMKPGARVIPARGRVRVALAYDARVEARSLATVAGFDLSPFDALAQSVRQIRVGEEKLSLMSEPADLFVFDFASPDYCAPSQSSVALASSGGRVNGITQWIALDLDEVTGYENRPGPGAKSCWAALFYPFWKPIDTRPRETIRVCGSHDRHHVSIWPLPSHSGTD
jgi:type II protein arginine methyltransferase